MRGNGSAEDMAYAQCPHEHYYDPAKNKECPFCPASSDLPVGWLVALNGPDRGKDFTIRSGSNTFGPPESQVIIDYDARSNRFLAHPAAAVETTQQLRTGDQIRVGQTTMIFIPLAGDSFRWA